ncbi:MAG: S-layer homology domain-containing protein [Clostridia bacterium]|nr:S-layer homology domain-containing protein [Clostridia bacterium]
MKTTKKLFSALLSAVMAASAIVCAIPAVSATGAFKDVAQKDWYYESVSYVYDTGIMDGIGDGKFAPKATLTRAMGVTLLYRTAGEPECDDLVNPFGDVGSSKWFTDPVKWAYDRGVVTGKSADRFAPNTDITRAEFATILARYADYADMTLPVKRNGTVKDQAKIPTYAKDAVSAMYCAEIINGRSDGSFDPSAKINRAEAAAMIERFVNVSSEDKDIIDGDATVAEGMNVKKKLYKYGASNVAILSVENRNSEPLTVTIKAYYKDQGGNVLKTESVSFEGFASGWHNYFVFEPGIAFADMDFELKTKAFSGEVLSGYVHTMDSKIQLNKQDENGAWGKDLSKATAEEIAECEAFMVRLKSYQTYEKPLTYSTKTVLFDNFGEIRTIVDYTFSNTGGYNNTGIFNAVAGLGSSAENPSNKTPTFPKNLIADMDKATSITSIGHVELFKASFPG